MHEPIHLGVIGNPKHKAFPSVFDGLARQHSRKPESFFKMVEKHTPNAFRVELFARASRPNWTTWGGQSTMFDNGDPETLKRERTVEARSIEPMSLFPNFDAEALIGPAKSGAVHLPECGRTAA